MFSAPIACRHPRATAPAAAILDGEVWEPDTIAFMAKHCTDGDIVHAGTYFGDFLPAVSKAVAEQALVWAFEPSAENFRCVQITLKLNGISNVVLTHAGLGACREVLILRTGEGGERGAGGASAIATEQLAGFVHEDAQILPLDEVIPQDRCVSILHLDVEHHEQQALTGALHHDQTVFAYPCARESSD